MEPETYSAHNVLSEVSSALLHERNVRALLDKVLAILNRALGISHGRITLRQDNTFTIEASPGLDVDSHR